MAKSPGTFTPMELRCFNPATAIVLDPNNKASIPPVGCSRSSIAFSTELMKSVPFYSFNHFFSNENPASARAVL